MALFISPVVRATDANNNPLSGAKWWFYETGTVTPEAVYTTSDLDVAHANPVVADAGGMFAPIYLDTAVTYRAVLKTSAGATIQDIDPYSGSGSGGGSSAMSGASVATRVILAGIASPDPEQTAYLSEDGREGWFVFDASNRSASVLVDTDQALFVAPSANTSGSAGAWVRQVENRTYLMSWWFGSATSGASAHAQFGRMADLLPDGAKLLGVPDGAFEVGAFTLFEQDGLELDGRGMLVTHNAAATAFSMFQFAGSNTHIDNFNVNGKPSNAGSGNTFCIAFSRTDTGRSGDGPLENVSIRNSELGNSSMPLFVFGNDTTYERVIGFKGQNLLLKTNVMAASLFAVENFTFENVRGEFFESVMTNNSGNGTVMGLRVLGSKNGFIENVDLSHPFSTRTDFPAVILDVGNMDGTSAGRIKNEDITLSNVRGTGFGEGITVLECKGYADIIDCRLENNVTGNTAATQGIYALGNQPSNSVNTEIGKVRVRGGYFIGFGQFAYYSAMEEFSATDFDFVQNENVAANTSRLFWCPFGAVGITEIRSGRFKSPINLNDGLHTTTNAAEHVYVYDNLMAESSDPTVAHVGLTGGGPGLIYGARNYPYKTGAHAKAKV